MNAIFNRLLRGRSNSNEDFLTILFSGLLELWDETDNAGFVEFIKWFSGKEPNEECEIINCFREADKYGKPDLWIQFRDLLILAENKWQAEPDPEQIKRYTDFLNKYKNSHSPINTSLVFINPNAHYTDWTVTPDMDLTWVDITKEIKNRILSPKGKNDKLRYYAEQFYQFMEDNNMTDKPIKWQYLEGAPELARLLILIQKDILIELLKEGAIKLNKGRKKPDLGIGKDYAGVSFYSVNDLSFWVGQYFTDRDEHGALAGLRFMVEASEGNKLLKRLKEEGFKQYEKDWWTRLFPFGANNYFFSKDLLEQKEAIKKFIKESINKCNTSY